MRPDRSRGSIDLARAVSGSSVGFAAPSRPRTCTRDGDPRARTRTAAGCARFDRRSDRRHPSRPRVRSPPVGSAAAARHGPCQRTVPHSGQTMQAISAARATPAKAIPITTMPRPLPLPMLSLKRVSISANAAFRRWPSCLSRGLTHGARVTPPDGCPSHVKLTGTSWLTRDRPPTIATIAPRLLGRFL